jgi:cobalt/nickel transport system permease protein
MHIPDGYLSPSTCAALYGAAAPFWYASLRRVRRSIHTRLVPLLSLTAAFSFVIMLFNLPLPGGTTGHAVGMGIAAIVLGPWAATLSISVALLIQALFFGDGGVMAFGANCFNIAVIGSLASYGVYRLVSGRAAIASRRRVLAAGLAGYAGINVAALLTAIELGVQPMLFKDAGGTPLYAPYPLRIAAPAMMLGHLTFAGLAELFVTAGVVAWLQRGDPALLRLTAPRALEEAGGAPEAPGRGTWGALRPLWIGLAALMLLTPAGLLATGAAWGEWAPEEFADPQMRRQITAASGNQEAPAQAPHGMERLASFWTAPIPDYAPTFLRSRALGYVLSAMFGVGLTLLLFLLVGRALESSAPQEPGAGRRASGKRRFAPTRSSFLERSVAHVIGALERSAAAEGTAVEAGLLQRLDPRVKVAGLLALLISSTFAHRLWVIFGVFCVALGLALFSRISFPVLAKRGWAPALFFSGLVALPAVFITPGRILYRLPAFDWPVTAQGIAGAALLVARVETAVTLTLLLVMSTPWPRVLKALRSLGAPAAPVMILGMTHRYIFLLLAAARDMFEARRSRTVGALTAAEARRFAASSAGVLLSRSLQLSGEAHLAMLSRGFRGEIYSIDEFMMRPRDWVALTAFISLAVAAVWAGR